MLAHAALLLMFHATAPMIAIPAGSYVPLYGRASDGGTRVEAFSLDRDAVTRGAYLDFVRRNPEWRRSSVRPVFAGPRYLAEWRGELDAGDASSLEQPVTGVLAFVTGLPASSSTMALRASCDVTDFGSSKRESSTCPT